MAEKKLNINAIKASSLNVEKDMRKFSKKGKIKGADKNHTKLLQRCDTGHEINEKGKKVARIRNNGDGTCTMKRSGQVFPTDLPSKKEIKEEFAPTIERTSEFSFIASSMNADKETQQLFATVRYLLPEVIKAGARVCKVAQKRDTMNKKGKRNKKRYNDNESIGGWSISR